MIRFSIDENKIIEIIQSYYPTGRFFSEIYNKDSNIYNVLWAVALLIKEANEQIFNKRIEGVYLSESTLYLEKFKKNFGIPNSIFKNDTGIVKQNIIDVYVMNYLCNSNTKIAFQKIANAYGIRAKISYDKARKAILVGFYAKSETRFVDKDGVKLPKFDIYFTQEAEVPKILYFYNVIKPINTTVEMSYLDGSKDVHDPDEPEFIPIKIGGVMSQPRYY